MEQTHKDHEHDERLTAHEFDGIREYDNPTPGWWHMIFWGSVVFSFLYIGFFSGECGYTPQDQWRAARAEHFDRLFGKLGQLEPDEETILWLTTEPDWMTVGAGIFASNCAQCHGSNAGGINGPNLTDDHYINVKNVTDVFDVITDGVVPKGMPTWGVRLNPNQRVVVAAYVASLRGTNVPGGIGPEATAKPIDPWPEPPRKGDDNE